MSRIASVKETGEEVSQADWKLFEQAVQVEVDERPKIKPVRKAVEPSNGLKEVAPDRQER